MQIRELEEKTGLDRATIRYYEREGFLTPDRKENGYRVYGEEEMKTLLKIKLLRKLGMPLETIRQLQQGSGDFISAMDAQITALEQQMSQNSRARDICREIREQRTGFAELDAGYYLQALERPVEIAGLPDPSRKIPFREAVPMPHHPVRRFLARILDYEIIVVLIQLLLIVVLRVRPYGKFLSCLVTYGSYFLTVPLDALFLSKFGTTPGKWLMGLQVHSRDGDLLTFYQAKEREWAVLRYGQGFGIPGWSVWRRFKSYQAYCQWPDMEWDEECEYIYNSWGGKRKAALAGIGCVIMLCMLWTSQSLTKPKYTGADLTIAQFAENYNYYLTVLDQDTAPSDKLLPNGEKNTQDSQLGVVTIYVGGQPEDTVENFQYETANGFLRKIRYENRWTDVFLLTSIPSQCYLATYTVLMSQDGMTSDSAMEVMAQWEQLQGESSGNLECGNVKIYWERQLENCIIVNDGSLIVNDDDDTAESFVTFSFEICIDSDYDRK